MAVAECLGQLTPMQMQELPLLVGVAEPNRPGVDTIWPRSAIADVERRLGVHFHRGLSAVIAKGHTAGFEALRVARDLLLDSTIAGCLVCGVDSLVNASSLQWLEGHSRLKHEDLSNGVIPGEAAAAVYVHRRPAPATAPLIGLAGLGFGHEKATVLSEEPLLGVGLTAAARAALTEAGLKLHDIDFRLSDATGETYGFKELALVVARLHRVWKAEVPHWHCADAIGDSGAAAGVCQLVIAAQAFRRYYAFGDRAICFTSGLIGDRAATVLRRWEAGG
jgi:3-oxoacyl-[acyl-carrier-protein] synthase-1